MSTIQIKCPQCGNDTFKVTRRKNPKDMVQSILPVAAEDEQAICSSCGFKTTRSNLDKALSDEGAKLREEIKKIWEG